MKTQTSFKNRKGMTLVEVLVANVLIAVGIMSLATLFPLARGRVTRSGNDAKAYALVQDGLERVRNWDYDSVYTRSLPVSGSDSTQYTRTLEVSANTPTAGISAAAVQVTFNDAKGPRTVKVATCFTRMTRR